MDRKENATKLIETVKSLMESDIKLRTSQVKALHQFTDDSEAPYRGIFKLATGVGKTRIMSMLALAHLQNNPNLQIVVGIPSMELFQQEIAAFQKYKDFQDEQRKKLGLPALSIPKRLDMGVFNQNRKDTTNQIIFTSYQSMENLTKRMDTDKVGLLLLDEAHHAISEKRSNAVKTFTKALHYGMTATPWYEPKRDAQLLLGPIVAKVDIVDAIHENALAEFKNVLMVSNLSVDLSKVKRDNTGDYREVDYCKAILGAMRGNSANSGNGENWREAHHYIAQEVAKFYHDYVDEHVGALNEKKCLINCRSQEEARIQAQELNKLFGRMVARVHISDECDPQTVQDFVSGKLPIVCQVGKLTEGFDMPDLDMTINYPTASFVREAQGAARCIRLPNAKNGVVPKKMGLVVDIAFKHPEYDNIVDAIRKNGQVLFQDVVGVPFVQHDDEKLQLPEMLNFGGGGGYVSGTTRLNFKIISNTRELIRLQREANKLAEERYVPPIRPGMLTPRLMGIEYGISDTIASKWLMEAFEKQEIFYLNSEKTNKHPIFLIEKVRNNGQDCLALHEASEARRKFEELYPKLLKSKAKKEIPQIRPGMLTAYRMKNEYGINDEAITKRLKESFEKGEVFYLESDKKYEHPIPLVEIVRTGSSCCLALNESSKAKQKFEELYPELLESKEKKKIPQIRPGMLTPRLIRTEYGTNDTTAAKWLKEVFEKAEVFYLESDKTKEHPIPLVEMARNHGQDCLALHEASEARRKFEELYPELLESKEKKDIPQIRPGMLNMINFCKEYGIGKKNITDWLKESFKKGEVFYLESDKKHEHPIPLVEMVRSSGSFGLALHESPEAKKKFEEIHPELLKSKARKDVPQIRPGMLTASRMRSEYITRDETISKWIKDAFEKKVVFYLESDKEKVRPIPLVENVRSGSTACLALHEKGLEAFKEWVIKTYGKELKERTTSPTLQPRRVLLKGKTKSLQFVKEVHQKYRKF